MNRTIEYKSKILNGLGDSLSTFYGEHLAVVSLPLFTDSYMKDIKYRFLTNVFTVKRIADLVDSTRYMSTSSDVVRLPHYTSCRYQTLDL